MVVAVVGRPWIEEVRKWRREQGEQRFVAMNFRIGIEHVEMEMLIVKMK